MTIMCGKQEWRIGLRDEEFLVPPGGKWGDIDDEVREILRENWEQLQEAWDRKYPSNPISSQEEDDDEDD